MDDSIIKIFISYLIIITSKSIVAVRNNKLNIIMRIIGREIVTKLGQFSESQLIVYFLGK